MKELLWDKRFFIPAIIFSLAEILYPLFNLLYVLFDDYYINTFYYIDLLSSFFVSLCILTTILFCILKIRKESIYFSIAALLIKIFISDPSFLSSLSLFIHNPDEIFYISYLFRRFIYYFPTDILPLLVLLIFSVLQIKSSRIRKFFILIPLSLRVCLNIVRSIIYYSHIDGTLFRVLFSLIIDCCIYGCIYYYEREFFSREYRTKDTPHSQTSVSYLEQYKQNFKKGGK